MVERTITDQCYREKSRTRIEKKKIRRQLVTVMSCFASLPVKDTRYFSGSEKLKAAGRGQSLKDLYREQRKTTRGYME